MVKLKEKREIEPERMGLAAYRLLTHVLASKPLSKLCTTHFACGYDILRDSFEKREIHHLLLEVAITYRVLIDSPQMRDEKAKIIDIEKSCHGEEIFKVGSLETKKRGRKEKKTEPLFMREACNKIIHAQKITISSNKGYIRKNAILEGFSQDKKEHWRANLDLTFFCEHSAITP